MTVSLADNLAVLDPVKALPLAARDCLLSIDFYRRHKPAGAYWLIGAKRFHVNTIAKLERHGLVRRAGAGFSVTMAGHLAITKLKGRGL